jgi:hypothetical protein
MHQMPFALTGEESVAAVTCPSVGLTYIVIPDVRFISPKKGVPDAVQTLFSRIVIRRGNIRRRNDYPDPITVSIEPANLPSAGDATNASTVIC